jgi:hypothetical protein
MAAIVALKAAGATLAFNYVVNVGSSWVYSELCVPHSVWDIPQSIVATASPVCSFFVSAIHFTQGTFSTVLSTTVAATLASVLRGS